MNRFIVYPVNRATEIMLEKNNIILVHFKLNVNFRTIEKILKLNINKLHWDVTTSPDNLSGWAYEYFIDKSFDELVKSFLLYSHLLKSLDPVTVEIGLNLIKNENRNTK